MKQSLINYIRILLLIIPFAGCNKYLDVEPRGIQLLTTTLDYDLWLNNSDLQASVPREINLLGDNVDNLLIPNSIILANDRIYTWADQYNPNFLDVDPVIWKDFYKPVNFFNTVILGVDDARGDEQQKASLKAEALLGRAFEYFYLVNLYGKPYDATTAGSDIAVPFVTASDVTSPVPTPSTVKVMYDHIIADLEAAIPNLPQDNSGNRYRGSKAAAYGMLARTYFYMRNYDEAAKNAQKALDEGAGELFDYNVITSSTKMPDAIVKPDIFYARIPSFYGTAEMTALDFIRTFDKDDLRLKYFYNPATNNPTARNMVRYYPTGYPFGKIGTTTWGPSVAEMYLMIAEAAARSGNLPKALDQLDELRKRRVATAAYTKFESTDPEEVLKKVLAERSFELPFNGLRWFDMRRLDKEGRMQTVTRLDAEGKVIATLPPHSPKYTLQIPIQTLYFNPDWPQNNR